MASDVPPVTKKKRRVHVEPPDPKRIDIEPKLLEGVADIERFIATLLQSESTNAPPPDPTFVVVVVGLTVTPVAVRVPEDCALISAFGESTALMIISTNGRTAFGPNGEVDGLGGDIIAVSTNATAPWRGYAKLNQNDIIYVSIVTAGLKSVLTFQRRST